MLLAYALGEAGKQVGIVDRDPQKTATQWLALSPGNNVSILAEGESAEVTFIDTPGSLEHSSLKTSIAEADRIILISSPSPADLWSTKRAAEMIRSTRKDPCTAILYNRVNPQTEFARCTDDYAKVIGFPALNTKIPQRQSFQRAALVGWPALKPTEREALAKVAIEILTFTSNS